MGAVEQPSNHQLATIEKLLGRMGLSKGSNWIPSLDRLTVNALFQRPGSATVYRAEAFNDNSGTHCRMTQEMGYILLAPDGSLAGSSIKGIEQNPEAVSPETGNPEVPRMQA